MFDIAKDMPHNPQKYALYWLTNYLKKRDEGKKLDDSDRGSED